MALQASGPIKYTEIREEFGDPLSTDTTNSYSVGWTYWTPPAPWVKSSDGVAGWYNSGDPAAWSQFMIDHAVYPSNTDPLVGTHQAIWRIGGEGMSLLPADTYTLECQSDNSATFTWDETFLGETSDLTTPDGINYSSHNTSTTFTFNTTTETYHYLTANVTNDSYQTPETGVTFDENGNLVTGAGSNNTLIRISIGWDDEKGGNDFGVAWESYTIPELGINFQVKNAGGNVTEWGARTQVVEVEPNKTYTATLIRGDGTTTSPWRHNNNQRFCIPDQDGTDANAQIWVSTPNNAFPSSSGERAELINRDRLFVNSLDRTSYYWPSNAGNIENNGSSGLYPDELDEEGNPTGNKVQIRGMVDPDVMSSNTTSDISGWNDTGVARETVDVDESEIYEVQVESISGVGGGGGGSEAFPGGYAGAAVCGTGYVVEGFINSDSIRGEYRPDFEGPTATYE